jgi:hypothetical protein
MIINLFSLHFWLDPKVPKGQGLISSCEKALAGKLMI